MNSYGLLILLVSYTTLVSPFTFLGNIKLPSIKNIQKSFKQKKFGDKKLCIITGTSSGLGKHTAKQLLQTGKWHVVGAVRDLDKMAAVAEMEEFSSSDFTPMECDLNSFESVKRFAQNIKSFADDTPIDRLVLNAAVYQPSLSYAKFSEDNIEQQIQTNYLSHFLLTSILMPDMKGSVDPRIISVGSVTGNDNTVGGGGVYPIADLRELEGLALGMKNPVEMVDGYAFNGAKAYKDSKMCLMMLTNILHEKYHKSTGIAFSSIYPGCIASSPLFREKRPWFRQYFPVFMKYITGGYVAEDEAGSRLFQVLTDPRCTRSGVYWSWNGGPREGRSESLKTDGKISGANGSGGGWDSIYENDQSDKVRDIEKATMLFKYSNEVTGAQWQPVKSPVSPCPTLVVIKAVTAVLDEREKLKRKANGLMPTRSAPGEAQTMKEALGKFSF